MVEVVDPGVEAAGVRRFEKAETLPIEVMAERMQQRVKEATIGRHLPEHGCAHPDPDPLLLEVVVTEKLRLPALPGRPRPRPQHAQSGLADLVGLREQAKDRFARGLDTAWIAEGDGFLQKRGAGLERAVVGESCEPCERVAFVEFATRLGPFGRAVRYHAANLPRTAIPLRVRGPSHGPPRTAARLGER